MDDNSGSAKRSRTLRQELADLDKIFLHIQNQQAKQQRELVQHVQAEQLMKVDIRGLEEQAPQEKKQRRNDLDQEQMDPKSMKTDINRVRMWPTWTCCVLQRLCDCAALVHHTPMAMLANG